MTRRRSAWLLAALGLLAFVLLRWLSPVVGVGNPDVGGILYSADRIVEGLLPYRDTLDMKPPGSFFFVAGVFRFLGRDLGVVHFVFACWLFTGAPAVGLAARALYEGGAEPDDRGLLAAAMAAALYLVSAGGFDMNYTSWMAPAYAWAFAWLVRGLRSGRAIDHLVAGLFAGAAYLLKTQAVVLAPLFVAVFLWGRRQKEMRTPWSAIPLWLGGAALAIAPLALLYASKGALGSLWSGIFPVENAILYTESRGVVGHDVRLLWLVPYQQIMRFPLQCALGAAAALGVVLLPKVATRTSSLVPPLLFYAASLIGCGLGGMRFFMHYLLQCVPPLALLGAHPAALDWLLCDRARPGSSIRRGFARAHAALVAVTALYVFGRIPFVPGALIENRGSESAILAGRFVADRTTPRDRLLVWGWGGWGAYYFADRRSPSVVFKVIGQLTDFNDNSAFSNGTAMHFRDGPIARRFLSEIDADPPAFVIRSIPFFPGASSDPLDELVPFKDRLAREYVEAATFGSLHVYERRGRTR